MRISELAMTGRAYVEMFLTFSHEALEVCSDCHTYFFDVQVQGLCCARWKECSSSVTWAVSSIFVCTGKTFLEVV